MKRNLDSTFNCLRSSHHNVDQDEDETEREGVVDDFDCIAKTMKHFPQLAKREVSACGQQHPFIYNSKPSLDQPRHDVKLKNKETFPKGHVGHPDVEGIAQSYTHVQCDPQR
jgi:hypothetical protein